MNNQPLIYALIPAYNEASRITPVIQAAIAHLPVIVVDDGSRDATTDVARAAGAQVIMLRPNQGKGAALRSGFTWALEAGAEAVVTLDADGQHDPAEIPTFLQRYAETGADLIIGARNFSQMPPSRRLANTLGRAAFSWALGQPVRDNQSGYRLVSRRLMLALHNSTEQGFEFEVEMLAVCARLAYRLEWVPIRTIYAGESSHIQPLKHVGNFLRVTWKVRRGRKGLK